MSGFIIDEKLGNETGIVATGDRLMRFEENMLIVARKKLTQEQVAQIFWVCERTFRHYINRCEEGLLEKNC